MIVALAGCSSYANLRTSHVIIAFDGHLDLNVETRTGPLSSSGSKYIGARRVGFTNLGAGTPRGGRNRMAFCCISRKSSSVSRGVALMLWPSRRHAEHAGERRRLFRLGQTEE